MREKQPEFRISPKETRFRTAVRRLEFDLLRHLRREAERGGVFEPDGARAVVRDARRASCLRWSSGRA